MTGRSATVSPPGRPDAAPPTSRARLLGPWIALALVLALVLAVTAVRSSPDDSLTARTRRLAEKIKCPECRGLSVADSNESTSEAIRADIRRRLEGGESEEDILAVYADRYGDDILLEPEGGGLGVVAWGLPVAVLVLGGGGVVLAVRRARRAAGRDQPDRLGGTAVSATGGPRPAAPAARRIAVVGGLVVFAAAAGSALAWSVGDREAGQGPTGAVPSTGVDAYTEHLRAARSLLADDPFAALKEYDAAADLEPDRPEPKAYGGWSLVLLAGQAPAGEERDLFVDGARERLDAALTADAEYADTYAFLGMLELEVLDDPGAAVPYLQRFLTLTPDGHALRDEVLAALEQATEAAPSSTTVPNTTTTPGP